MMPGTGPAAPAVVIPALSSEAYTLFDDWLAAQHPTGFKADAGNTRRCFLARYLAAHGVPVVRMLVLYVHIGTRPVTRVACPLWATLFQETMLSRYSGRVQAGTARRVLSDAVDMLPRRQVRLVEVLARDAGHRVTFTRDESGRWQDPVCTNCGRPFGLDTEPIMTYRECPRSAREQPWP